MKGLALTVVLVAYLLSGCAERGVDAMEPSGVDEVSSQASPSAGGVTVVVSEFGSGMEARKGGRLEILSGCLGVGGAVVVWPPGTDVVKDEPLTIDVPNYGSFALGDKVPIGGGSAGDVGPGDWHTGGSGMTVPAACVKHGIFLAG